MNLADIEGRTAWTAAAPLVLQVLSSDRQTQSTQRTHLVLAMVLLCLVGVHVVLSGSANKSKERIKYENAVLSINNLFRNSDGLRWRASGLLRHLGVQPGKEQEHRDDGANEDVGHAPAIRFSAGYQCAFTHLDLTGSPATNESPMGGPNQTVSKWDGNRLVTTWTGQSAVSGKNVVRTETRSLSPDGKVMTVESVRGSNPPLVMVFEKK